MKMKKMICAAFCGLAVLTMAGCGELKPDQVNGVYKNEKVFSYCMYSLLRGEMDK